MSFTDRYIKVPIRLFDRKHKELTGIEICEDGWMKVNPFDIAHYRPAVDEDQLDTTITLIKMRSGESILVYMHPVDFEKMLNDFGNR